VVGVQTPTSLSALWQAIIKALHITLEQTTIEDPGREAYSEGFISSLPKPYSGLQI